MTQGRKRMTKDHKKRPVHNRKCPKDDRKWPKHHRKMSSGWWMTGMQVFVTFIWAIAHMCMCTHTWIWVCRDEPVRVYIYTHTYTYKDTHQIMYTYTCTHAYAYMNVYICMCIYKECCSREYRHTHMHTHTQIHTNTLIETTIAEICTACCWTVFSCSVLKMTCGLPTCNWLLGEKMRGKQVLNTANKSVAFPLIKNSLCMHTDGRVCVHK